MHEHLSAPEFLLPVVLELLGLSGADPDLRDPVVVRIHQHLLTPPPRHLQVT